MVESNLFRSPKLLKLVRNLKSTWRFSIFTFRNLPMMWFAGVGIKEISQDRVVVSLPFRWSTINPFNSVYFAAQSGAAELSTGIPVLLAAKHFGDMSMLIVSFKAEFYKKAQTGLVFVCKDVIKSWKAVEQANQSDEGVDVILVSDGYNSDNELVGRYEVHWSIKKRRN